MSQRKRPEILHPAHSPVFLASESDLRRLPRSANRSRSRKFVDCFEDRALFYDCFWHHDGSSVLLVGPPPLNLMPYYQAARFVAQPSGEEIEARLFPSRSTMTTQLSGVPDGSTEIIMSFAGADYKMTIQQNLATQLNGSRLLFTMNKDNDLNWIADWAHYHAVTHQTDTIVLFDNGSTHYGLDELEGTLAAIPGLKNIVLFSWPYKFGFTDHQVLSYRHWAHFLQISSMSLILRRLGMRSEALLNCDIDELVMPIEGTNVYKVAREAHAGVAALAGTWVDAVVGEAKKVPNAARSVRHRDFCYVRRDFTGKLCPRKWALDPKQEWVSDLDVFPYWHRIMGAPDRKITENPVGHFFHFRGINTNWKNPGNGRQEPSILHKRSDELMRLFEAVDAGNKNAVG